MTALGFSVQAVADGEAALALDTGGIDVVMLDVNLPGRDGMAIARALRVRQPALRIVGCSAEAFAATRDAALAAGMDAYLTKPISLAELERAVRQPGAMPGDLFARLYSNDTTLRARAQLRSDWSRLRERTESALAEVTAGREVAGIGLSGQMHGLVTLDDRGEVIRPAILWNDQRTAEECAEIEARIGLDRLIELTGNRPLTGFTAPKLLWLRRHEPEVYARIARVLSALR